MAEGGAGWNRNSVRNCRGPRHWESSRVCKFYLQGYCYYGEICRFRHVDVSQRAMQEDFTSSRGERNDNRSQSIVPRERKPKHSSENSVAKTNFPLGANRRRNTESSVAIRRSKDKACGICYEVIMEKSKGERKFGILSNCNHCYCLACIRKWRRANDSDFDHNITRNCPECRVLSDFVCPSWYWVEGKEEKEKLIKDYKEALSEKDCKYFRTRNGRCPFGDKCFYKHTYPTGAQTGARQPTSQRRRNIEVEIVDRGSFYGHDYDSESDLEEFEPCVSLLSDSERAVYDVQSICLIL